jgi:hypothetical protein
MLFKDPAITQEYLKSVLDYDPETGVFRWKFVPGAPNHRNAQYAGKVAGSHRGAGYVSLWVNNRKIGAHTAAWIMVHGSWPAHTIDHINRDRSDNRIVNLRDATPSQQGQNCELRGRIARGVSFSNNRFNVSISVNNQYKYIGTFTTVEEAVAAYNAAAVSYFGPDAALAEVPADAPTCVVKHRWGFRKPTRIPKELQKKRGRREGFVVSEASKRKMSETCRAKRAEKSALARDNVIEIG